jgi:ATP synthase F1 gamma subunit
MLNNREINQEIQQLLSFNILVETYEEIAASRMRRIRASVLQSRDFITELSSIFSELKTNYKKQFNALVKKHSHTSSGTALRQKNHKTLVILLSANTGLYGNILQTTVNSFIDYVNKNECDVAIVGRYGRRIFENVNPGWEFTYFDFPDKALSSEDTAKILEKLLAYSNVYIFHGKFISIVKQEPTMATISTDNISDSMNTEAVVRYFFEPSLEEILVFFEEEIFAAVFEQAVHESELAKFASRMVTLDNATENIRERVKKVEMMKRLIHHRTLNKKQQDGLNAIMLTRRQ